MPKTASIKARTLKGTLFTITHLGVVSTFFFNSSNLLTIVEMEKILNAADSSIERESRSVVSDSLQPHGLYSPGNSPAQDTGVGSLLLLQGIFLT